MFTKTVTKNFQNFKIAKENKIYGMQKRMMMLLHEYQAQNLLKKFNVPIPKVYKLDLKIKYREQLLKAKKILSRL